MRAVDKLFNEYSESHGHPVNKFIHWICVPIIFWAITALLWSVKFNVLNYQLNLALIAFIPVLIYYLKLSAKLFVGLLIFILLCVIFNWLLDLYLTALPMWKLALILFVLAWVGQFIGHHLEGKKPSFLKDLQFLLIGPAWLMHFTYKALGLRY